VIRISDNALIKTVPVGTFPFGVAITPDGSKAYVTQRSFGPTINNTVSVIQTSDNTLLTTVTVGSSPFAVAITPDGSEAWVANSDGGTVSVIRTSDNTLVATVNVGSGPNAVANHARRQQSVRDELFRQHRLSDPDQQPQRRGDDKPRLSLQFPSGVAVTPDGAKVYVTNNLTNSVSVIDALTNAVTKTVPVGVLPQGIAISPDGASPT
jgi:YVTN family beta-propeller protein